MPNLFSFSPELPPIQLAPHARAKRLKLTVSQKDIRLSFPPRTSKQHILNFLNQHQEWLKSAWLEQQQREKNHTPTEFPQHIQLTYVPHKIGIQLDFLDKNLYEYQLDKKILTLHQEYKEYALTQFIINYSKLILPKKLTQYALAKNLQINHIRIATPKTRWGSCSHEQHIMLHAGLMLMPEDFADYVIWHELAHTKEMNHQASYWQFLETLLPNAKAKQAEVKRFKLPFWWQVKIER